MFNPIRAIARPMLASMFVMGGLDALRNPEQKAPKARDVVEPLTQQVPQLSGLDTPQAVRVNGAVQVAGGVALGLGKAPRLASAALAASLVPTTIAGHRFWEESDPATRANQRIHFFKNLSMLGGLLLSALDTEGRPGVAWRTKHAAEHAEIHGEHARREAALAAEAAQQRAKRATADARAAAKRAKQRLETEAEHQADTFSTRMKLAKKQLTPDVADAKRLVDAVRS